MVVAKPGSYTEYNQQRRLEVASVQRPEPEAQAAPDLRGSYWNDPRNVAMHYLGIQADVDNQVDWAQYGVDPNLVTDAWKYMAKYNEGKTFEDWSPLPSTDMFAQFIAQQPEPTPDGQWRNPASTYDWTQIWGELTPDSLASMGIAAPKQPAQPAAKPPTVTMEEWSSLPSWQKTMYGIQSSGVMSGMATMAPWAALAGISAIATGGLSLAALGAVAAPLALGALIGTTAPGTTIYSKEVAEKLGLKAPPEGGTDLYGALRLQYGNEPWIDVMEKTAGNTLMLLNYPAEKVEQILGTAGQLADSYIKNDGDMQAILDNLPAVWEASRLTYESIGTGVKIPGTDRYLPSPANVIPGIEYLSDMLTKGTTDVRFAPMGYAHVIGQAEPVAVPADGAALIHMATQEMIRNKDVSRTEIVEKYQQAFGFSGQFADLMFQSLLDPLNIMPQVETGALKGFSKITHNPILEAAANTTSKFDAGALRTMQQYKEYLQRPGVWAKGMPAKFTPEGKYQYSTIERIIGGITEEGLVDPVQRSLLGKIDPTGIINKANTLNPQTQVVAAWQTIADALPELYGVVQGDLGAYTQALKMLAGADVQVSADVARMLNSPAIATARQMLKDFDVSSFDSMLKARELGTRSEAAIRNLATATGREYNDVLAVLVRGSDAELDVLLKQFDTASAGNNPIAGVTPDEIRGMAKLFKDAPYAASDDHFIAHASAKLDDHVVKTAEKMMGDTKVKGWENLVAAGKAVQNAIFLHLNPGYLVNNVVTNNVHRMFDGVYGLATGKHIDNFFDNTFKMGTSRLHQGFGAAEYRNVAGELDNAYAKLKSAIRKARRSGDVTQKMADVAEEASQMVAIMSKLSAQAEARHGASAVYYGVRKSYPDIAKNVIGDLDPQLKADLRRLGYDPKRILDIMRHETNPDAAAAKLNAYMGGQGLRPNAAALVDEIVGPKYGQGVAKLLNESGVIDELQGYLDRGMEPRQARKKLAIQLDDTIKEYIAREAPNIVAEQSALASSDPSNVMKMMVDRFQARSEMDARHAARMTSMWEATRDMEYTERNHWIDSIMTEEDKAFANLREIDQAYWVGNAEGMKLQGTDAWKGMVVQRKGIDDGWQKYHDVKRQTWKDFSKDMKKRNLTADDMVWWDEYRQVQEVLGKMYEDMADQELRLSLEMGKFFEDSILSQYPDLNAGQKAALRDVWLESAAATLKHRQLINDIRRWERGDEGTYQTPEFNAFIEQHPEIRGKGEMWSKFYEEVLMPGVQWEYGVQTAAVNRLNNALYGTDLEVAEMPALQVYKDKLSEYEFARALFTEMPAEQMAVAENAWAEVPPVEQAKAQAEPVVEVAPEIVQVQINKFRSWINKMVNRPQSERVPKSEERKYAQFIKDIGGLEEKLFIETEGQIDVKRNVVIENKIIERALKARDERVIEQWELEAFIDDVFNVDREGYALKTEDIIDYYEGKRKISRAGEQPEPPLTPDQINRLLAGEDITKPTEPAPAAAAGGAGAPRILTGKPIRFEIGKKLNKVEKAEVLKSLGDSYIDMGAPKTEKGFNQYDEIKTGFEPYNTEYMYVSDITGRYIRHYIILPDGRKAHPTELFPEITQTEIKKSLSQLKHEVEQAKRLAESRSRRIVPAGTEDIKGKANQIYHERGRKIEDSYFAANEAGDLVRVDGKDADDVAYFTEQGFKPITTPVGKEPPALAPPPSGLPYDIAPMTPERLRQRVAEAFPDYTPEQVNAHMAIVDQLVESIAKRTGKSKAELYNEIADVRPGSEADMQNQVLKAGAEEGTRAAGAYELIDDGRALIHAFEGADVSTFSHEVMHVYDKYIPDADKAIILDWLQETEWKPGVREWTADAFNKYLSEGVAPSNKLADVFLRMRDWLLDIWRRVGDPASRIELSDEVRGVFDRMLGDKAQEILNEWEGKKPGDTPPVAEAEPAALSDIEGVKVEEAPVETGQVPVIANSKAYYIHVKDTSYYEAEGYPISGNHVLVKGSKIDIPGWEDYDFFGYKGSTQYVISDGLTGAEIGKGATKAEAIKNLNEKSVILERNYKQFADMQNAYVAREGMTPRYTMGEPSKPAQPSAPRKKGITSKFGYDKTQIEYIASEIAEWLPEKPPKGKTTYGDYGAYAPGEKSFEHRTQFVATKKPPQPLVIDVPGGGRMTLTSYEGAARVYRQLTGQKPKGWEDLGKEVFFQKQPASSASLLPGAAEHLLKQPSNAETQAEGYYHYMQPALDAILLRMEKDGITPSGGALPPEVAGKLKQYLGQAMSQQTQAKAAAVRVGLNMRDFSLLNYDKRYNFDTGLSAFFPYQFWMTRSMANWAIRALDKPSILSHFARLAQFMSTYDDEEKWLPTRLRGKVRIGIPGLPEWAGGGVFFDPIRKIFPFMEFMRPYEQIVRNQSAVENKANDLLRQWAVDGEITYAEAQEAKRTRSGPLWDKAAAESQGEEGMDIMDTMGLLMSPALYLTFPFKKLTGQEEEIGPFPTSRLKQALSAALGIDLPMKGNLINKNPSVAAFGKWGDWYIDRQISNMVGDGTVEAKAGQQAIITHEGPIYEQAVERVRMEVMLKTPGALPVYMGRQALKGEAGLTDVLGSLAMGWLPNDLLPQGELELRGLQDEYSQAFDLYHQGDRVAIDRFLTEHPEYSARVTLFKEPEERLPAFLKNEVWDGYTALPSAERSYYVEAFGQEFQDFLDGNTDDIDTETLAGWARTMGGAAASVDAQSINVPKPEQNVLMQLQQFKDMVEQQYPGYSQVRSYIYGLPEDKREAAWNLIPGSEKIQQMEYIFMSQNPKTIEHLAPSWILEYDPPVQKSLVDFYASQALMFPNIGDTWEQYWQMPEGAERRSFWNAHPELEAQSDWKKEYVRMFPQLKGIVSKEKPKPAGMISNIAEKMQEYPMLAMHVGLGVELSAGEKKMLEYIWEESGRPYGSLSTFMQAFGYAQ